MSLAKRISRPIPSPPPHPSPLLRLLDLPRAGVHPGHVGVQQLEAQRRQLRVQAVDAVAGEVSLGGETLLGEAGYGVGGVAVGEALDVGPLPTLLCGRRGGDTGNFIILVPRP